MARKHNLKRNRVSMPVERTLLTPAVTERKIVMNQTTGQYEVQQVVVKPAVYRQGHAAGQTVVRVDKRGRK